MSYTWNAFDPQGVLTLRRFPDVGHLPAIHDPGELCVVDDGTTTTVYQSLNVAGVLGWYIVAFPVPPSTLVRINPADARQLQFSTDDGTTWPFTAIVFTYAITVAPLGSENTITGSDTAVGLWVSNNNNNNALVAEATGAPAIETIALDGTGSSPHLFLNVEDSASYPSLIEAKVDSVIYKIVNRFGAIVAERLATLPTASADWEQAFAYQTSSVGINAKVYVCIELGDGTFTWALVAPQPSVPESGGLTPYPDLPGIGEPPVTFTFLVMAQGCPLPWAVPAGYKVTVVQVNNQWGYDDGSNTYFNNPVGSDTLVIDGLPLNRMLISPFIVNSHGKVTGTGTIVDGLVEYTVPETAILVLGANQAELLSLPPAGIAVVSVTVEAPGASSVDIEYDDGTGPASASIGDEITVTPTVYGAFGGYSQFVLNFSIGGTPRNVTVQWVSGDVTGRSGGGVDFCWAPISASCDNTNPHYYLDSSGTDPAIINAHQGETHLATHMSSTGGASAGPFVFLILSID